METKDYTNENIILVETLTDYLTAISDLRGRIKKEEGAASSAQQLYFRGQANSDWDVTPSAYRGNLLADEPDLIRSAYLRNPVEFRDLSNNFEGLAKLQHYGLPTRLLDVTTNPLVALYFACLPYDEIQEEEETGIRKLIATDGAVFYKRTYGRAFQDIEIETVALLATTKIQGDLTLERCLGLLVENGVYSPSAAQDCRRNGYKSLIQSLQNNYFVISTLNNERLIRQSGAFLLPGQYNIVRNTSDIGNSLIQRATGNLADEFEETRFLIPSEKKGDILDDLDQYNINEGSLFPELEHQMSYIKDKKLSFAKGLPHLGQFNKIQATDETQDETLEHTFLDDAQSKRIFADVLSQHLTPSLVQDALASLLGDLCLDWYQKESVLSTMRLHLTKLLSAKPDYDRASALKKADEILNSILSRIQ